MLTLELSGQAYNKTAHRRALLARLDGRTEASIEQKHRNISAVMVELGFPPIDGYKRLDNYQNLLIEVIEQQVSGNELLDRAALAAVEQPAVMPLLPDANLVMVPAPVGKNLHETPPVYAPRFNAVQRDYLARESRNRSLGLAGELFVVEFEARRLHQAGHKALSDRVEHVAKSQGDGLGYDVLSFEETGRERLIEVKTTAFGMQTPFYVSRNEVARSQTQSEDFHLYRLFEFRKQPRLFDLPGMISQSCRLDAVSYLARVS
ncbi:MAG: DUF3883 domain-containing protein [Pseudoxanthomonas sp.]